MHVSRRRRTGRQWVLDFCTRATTNLPLLRAGDKQRYTRFRQVCFTCSPRATTGGVFQCWTCRFTYEYAAQIRCSRGLSESAGREPVRLVRD